METYLLTHKCFLMDLSYMSPTNHFLQHQTNDFLTSVPGLLSQGTQTPGQACSPMSPRMSRWKHQSQSWHDSVCSAGMAGRLGRGNLFSLVLLHYFNMLLVAQARHLLRARIRHTESKGFPQGRTAWDVEQQLQPSIWWVRFYSRGSTLSSLQPSERFRTEIFSSSAPLLHSSSPTVYLRRKLLLTTTISLGSWTAMISWCGISRSKGDNMGCRFHI